MKRGIVILIVLVLQICPVMANERNEEQPSDIPDSEQVGGTIYGSLSGTPFEEQPSPDPGPKPDPQPIPQPNPITDYSTVLGSGKSEKNAETTGSNTGDQSSAFLWFVLFIGAYLILRNYVPKKQRSE